MHFALIILSFILSITMLIAANKIKKEVFLKNKDSQKVESLIIAEQYFNIKR